MPLTDEIIDQAVLRYRREHDRYKKMADLIGDICRNLVQDNVIRGHVVQRAKSPERLRLKLKKYQTIPQEINKLNTVEDVFARVSDLCGVRITTYRESDRGAVADHICERFVGRGDGQPHRETKSYDDPDNFYRAVHCQVKLTNDDLEIPNRENLADLSCEIQICSMLAHVWNEIEHDLTYKKLSGDVPQDARVRLNVLGEITKRGDNLINDMLNSIERHNAARSDKFVDAFAFVANVRERHPFNKIVFNVNSHELFEQLRQLNLDTPVEVDKLVEGRKIEDLQADVESFGDWLSQNNYTAPKAKLSQTSSDVLLVALLKKHAQEIADNNSGVGAPKRAVYLARRFLNMLTAAHTTKPEAKAP